MTDSEPFEAFMRQYQNMVYTTALRLLGREADAQDIAQEVFLKAYPRFEELQQSPTAGGWLRKVTTNLCLNHLTRYRARWRFFSEMTLGDEGDEREIEFAAPAEEAGAGSMQDEREVIERALLQLPAAQRVPLVLYHFDDLSYDEIARQVGASLSKIKTDIHRGREALKRKLRLRLPDEPIAATSSGGGGRPMFSSLGLGARSCEI